MEGDDTPIYVGHPQLYHYTSWNGLEGITKSNRLRATRYDFLNDVSEVVHFRDALVASLSSQLRLALKPKLRCSLKVSREVRSGGGLFRYAAFKSSDLVDRLYQVTFGAPNAPPPFAVPFIASFCSHVADQPYEHENGLLSQWRGYGQGAGFALVFDTAKLKRMLDDEWATFDYAVLKFSDAVYTDASFLFDKHFSGLVEKLAWAAQYEGGGPPPGLEECFNDFVSGATRIKHQAFREEREVRIIACPQSPQYRALFRSRGILGDADKKALKPIIADEASGRLYLELFNASNQLLPITRVIVGPGKNQVDAVTKAKSLQASFRVFTSKTPYNGA